MPERRTAPGIFFGKVKIPRITDIGRLTDAGDLRDVFSSNEPKLCKF